MEVFIGKNEEIFRKESVLSKNIGMEITIDKNSVTDTQLKCSCGNETKDIKTGSFIAGIIDGMYKQHISNLSALDSIVKTVNGKKVYIISQMPYKLEKNANGSYTAKSYAALVQMYMKKDTDKIGNIPSNLIVEKRKLGNGAEEVAVLKDAITEINNKREISIIDVKSIQGSRKPNYEIAYKYMGKDYTDKASDFLPKFMNGNLHISGINKLDTIFKESSSYKISAEIYMKYFCKFFNDFYIRYNSDKEPYIEYVKEKSHWEQTGGFGEGEWVDDGYDTIRITYDKENKRFYDGSSKKYVKSLNDIDIHRDSRYADITFWNEINKMWLHS